MNTSPERRDHSPLGRLLMAIATAIATIFVAAGQADIGAYEVRWGIATFGLLAVILLVADGRRAWKQETIDSRRRDEPRAALTASLDDVERGSPAQLEPGGDESTGLAVDRDA